MKITEEMVDYVSALARLKLADEERSAMAAELEHILEYMEMLGGLDTHDIAPMSHIFPVRNVLRADVAAPSMDRAVLLSVAPVPDGEAFLVPKAVD